jgi:hypothetical protein
MPSRSMSRQAPSTIASRIEDGLRPASVSCCARKTSLRQMVHVAPWSEAKQSRRLAWPKESPQLQ